jgi:hypothetical protein
MSESGVLGELVGLCDELLNVVLDFPISARQYNDANATQSAQTTGRFVDLLQWLHYEEWLSEQVKLYEAKRIVMKGHGSNGNHDDDDDDNDADLNGADGGAADVDNRNWGRREKQLFNDIVQLQEDTFARSSQLLANKEIVKRFVFFFFFFFSLTKKRFFKKQCFGG